MIKRLLKSVREYKKASILSPLLVAGEVVFECIIPLLTAGLINNISRGCGMDIIIKYGLALIVLAMFSLLFGVLSGHYSAIASAGFAKNLRRDLFEKVQQFSFANIDKISTASLVSRLTTDVSNVQMAYMMIIRVAVRSPLMLIFAFAASIIVGKKLAWIFVGIIPVLLFGLIIMMAKVMPLFKSVFKKYDNLNESVQENVKAIRVVKSFVREDYEIEKLQENTLKYTTTGQSGSLRYNKLIVPRKYTYTLKFSDGTEVILNAGSILRYPVDFAGDKREVELVGEAFFKVAKSDKPFLVRMGENNITVYGTQFNVYSRENHDLEIVLVEGSIGFKAGNQKEIKLRPSQMVVRQLENGEIRVKEVNPRDYIMWVENKGQTLGRIMSELSIWYGVQIKVRPDQENTKLTLITNKDNSLDEVFKFITEITGVEIIKIGNMEYRTE